MLTLLILLLSSIFLFIALFGEPTEAILIVSSLLSIALSFKVMSLTAEKMMVVKLHKKLGKAIDDALSQITKEE